jgi:hypothetical protein
MSLFLYFNTQTMKSKSLYATALLCFPLKPYTLVGFEPGSSVPEVDVMSTAPRRHARALSHIFT